MQLLGIAFILYLLKLSAGNGFWKCKIACGFMQSYTKGKKHFRRNFHHPRQKTPLVKNVGEPTTSFGIACFEGQDMFPEFNVIITDLIEYPVVLQFSLSMVFLPRM